MVYRGRPSKSCRQCRKRDIKCDKKKDGCSQCSRAGLSCPGYHNPKDLIILDESDATIKRVSVNQTIRQSSSPNPLSIRLLPTVMQRAKGLYISQYVGAMPATSIFCFMQIFYPPMIHDIPILETVTRAVFMVNFSLSHGCHAALHHARAMYGSALRMTRKALQIPDEVMLDRTLFSVILMCVFERLASFESDESVVPRSHLSGACELMSLRGTGQFADKYSPTMLLHLTELVVLDCLARGSAIPLQLLSLRRMALDNAVDTSSLKWKFWDIMLRYVQLENSVTSGHRSEEVILRAEQLDLELEELACWLPAFVSRRQSPMPLNMSFAGTDIYPDCKSLTNWNNFRVVRLLLARIVREQGTRLPVSSADHTSLDNMLYESNRKAVDLTSDILYSCSSEVLSSQQPCDLSLNTLLWHLYVAKTQELPLGHLESSLHDQMLRLSTIQAPGQRATVKKILTSSAEDSRNVWRMWLKFGRNEFLI
ncbi:Zn(II)2Cys6 transcription factor domain-containing protein [Aspergillus fijiensis CBS 313.89]|uniref:C6 transcription factor n=1 Tax=Aspergillus fijiensis CBS 313.89 TaxID=1448319 RepID=A0A8G1RGZ2_9EURO|nr:C6 transcription factor [Aspergillus fijiensis CBS 313.89]RAK73029.1 C6 transcription factor [Aspergillus fijiensis CBS 313.89]